MFGLLVIGWAPAALGQTIFGPTEGGIYGTGTGSGHGGAVTPFVLTSHLFADVPETWRVAGFDRISVNGLVTSDSRGMRIAILNDNQVAVLHLGMPNGVNLNGNYEFVDEAGIPSLAEAAEGMSDSQTLPSGTYRMSGGGLIFGDSGNGVDFAHFVGTSVRPGWRVMVLNYSLENTGRFDSWSASVHVEVVPEPATMAVMALGLATLRLRRREFKVRYFGRR